MDGSIYHALYSRNTSEGIGGARLPSVGRPSPERRSSSNHQHGSWCEDRGQGSGSWEGHEGSPDHHIGLHGGCLRVREGDSLGACQRSGTGRSSGAVRSGQADVGRQHGTLFAPMIGWHVCLAWHARAHRRRPITTSVRVALWTIDCPSTSPSRPPFIVAAMPQACPRA